MQHYEASKNLAVSQQPTLTQNLSLATKRNSECPAPVPPSSGACVRLHSVGLDSCCRTGAGVEDASSELYQLWGLSEGYAPWPLNTKQSPQIKHENQTKATTTTTKTCQNDFKNLLNAGIKALLWFKQSRSEERRQDCVCAKN